MTVKEAEEFGYDAGKRGGLDLRDKKNGKNDTRMAHNRMFVAEAVIHVYEAGPCGYMPISKR